MKAAAFMKSIVCLHIRHFSDHSPPIATDTSRLWSATTLGNVKYCCFVDHKDISLD